MRPDALTPCHFPCNAIPKSTPRTFLAGLPVFHLISAPLFVRNSYNIGPLICLGSTSIPPNLQISNFPLKESLVSPLGVWIDLRNIPNPMLLFHLHHHLIWQYSTDFRRIYTPHVPIQSLPFGYPALTWIRKRNQSLEYLRGAVNNLVH
jgi:hypothetical protein